MRSVLGELTDAEWARLCESVIMTKAVETNPRAFTKEETIAILREELAVSTDIYHNHEAELRHVEDWEFQLSAGEILAKERD